MTQNTSHAVMAQRHEPHDSLDFFPTPPWATRALCEHGLFRIGAPSWNPGFRETVCYRPGLSEGCVAPHGHWVPPQFPVAGLSVWEPACGTGDMARPLGEYFGTVHASDVHDYGGNEVRDFLFPGDDPAIDWIITNPPFRLAAEFAHRALGVARDGVALLVRSAFLEGVERYETLFRDRPPSVVLQYAERVPMVKGRLDPAASSATSYCWIVWRQHMPASHLPVIGWIPPCRRKLERPGDYDLPLEQAA